MCHGDVVALRHLRCAKETEDKELAGAEGFGGWLGELGTGNWKLRREGGSLWKEGRSLWEQGIGEVPGGYMGLGTEVWLNMEAMQTSGSSNVSRCSVLPLNRVGRCVLFG